MNRRETLESKHGTYREFEDAVWNAVGEISVAEARAACESYRHDLTAASLVDLEDAALSAILALTREDVRRGTA